MIEHAIHGAKKGGKKPHTPVETPNNLISVAYAKVLMAVAEGELAGTPSAKDIYLDGTPLQNENGSMNFGGVKWEWRPGTVDQEYIAGLPEVSTEYTVGIELTNTVNWNRSITKSQLDAVRVTFQWPALQEQAQNGDTNGYTMKYAIDISDDGGASFELYREYTITGKTNSVYERTHRVDLPKSSVGWVIRARRITPEANTSRIQDQINVKSYAEVVDTKQRYPNTALLYVEFDSRLFGGGSIPRVSVRTKGRYVRVPDNYNAETRVYSGIWSGAFQWSWTDNPVWIYHDILTEDRFGLGNKVTADMVDKWALYEVAQYCDVMVDDGTNSGTLEPRHTCNIYIQDKRDAWQVLRDMASIFNGMTYWNGNNFVAVADKEENISNIPVFSRSNVVNGRFDYSSADDKSIYTSALVSYDDPLDHYSTQVEAVFETSEIIRWGGDRQLELSAIGCTSRGEAQRRGKYALLTNMLNRTVVFRTGLQGLSQDVLPGKVIHVVDPLIGGRAFTGRIKVAVGTVVTLDRNTEAQPGDILYVTRANGITEGRTIVSSTDNVVTVSVAYTEQPQPDAIWYLEASDLKSQLYRVTKVTSTEESVYEIHALEYNESKYSAIDTGARLEPRAISVVPPASQAAPTNVRITSGTYVEQTMAVTTMTVTWDQMANATSYEGQWRVGNSDWVNLGVTGALEFNVKGIYTGQYQARIRAVNANGVKSVWVNSPLTNIAGKSGTPPTITSLVTTGMIFGIRLDWTFPPGAEDTQFTEIRYSENTSFAQSQKLGDFAYPTDYHEMHGLSAGKTFYFWARLIDKTGNIGNWYPVETGNGIMGTSLINDNGQYNDYFAQMISETALDNILYDRIQLIDGNGPGSVNERIEVVNDKLDSEVADLQDQINNIHDAMLYDPTKTYLKGDIVRVGNKLYQAEQNVPINTSPPNATYWKDVGTILNEANALAAQVSTNTTNISTINGKLTSQAQSLESITAAYRDDDGNGDLVDALNSYTHQAQIIEESKVRASQDEVSAQKLVVISAEVGDNKAQISTLETTVANNDFAMSQRVDRVAAEGKWANTATNAALTSEITTRVSSDEALGTRIDQLSASMTTENAALSAAISSEQTARVTADNALGTRIDTVQANFVTEQNRVNAAIQNEATTRADADGALATDITTVQAVANGKNRTYRSTTAPASGMVTGDLWFDSDDNNKAYRYTGSAWTATDDTRISTNSASIQTLQTTTATIDGKVSASWAVKMELNAQNQYVAAGIGLGIENGPAGLQSQFLVRADKFAVVNGTTTTTSAPFVVQSGQVFISQALIGTGWITNAMIGNVIQSNNYVLNSTGWKIDKAGTIEINGAVSGQGRMTITNAAIKVYDGAGVLRVQLGNLSA